MTAVTSRREPSHTTGRAAPRAKRPLTIIEFVKRALGWMLIALLVVFCVVPFAWVVLSAVDAQAGPNVQAPSLSLENFVHFFTESGTPRLLVNSLVMVSARRCSTSSSGWPGATPSPGSTSVDDGCSCSASCW